MTVGQHLWKLIRPCPILGGWLLTTFCLSLPAAPDLAWAAAAQPAIYHVQRGDNLSVIAQRLGTTVKALKRDNKLSGDLIRVGQPLRLTHPFARLDPSRIRWGRPLRHPGPVLRPFGPYRAGGILMPRTGTELACSVGTNLYNPALGVVRHSARMEGYGHLLIIEHPGRFATVLAPCDPASLAVTVGQVVQRGDLLAKTGAPVDTGAKPYVHVELRHADKAIPPDRLLK